MCHPVLYLQEWSRDVPDVQGAPRGGAVPLLQDPVLSQQPGRGRWRQPHEEHPHGEASQVVLRAQDDATAQVCLVFFRKCKITPTRLRELATRMSQDAGVTQLLIQKYAHDVFSCERSEHTYL